MHSTIHTETAHCSSQGMGAFKDLCVCGGGRVPVCVSLFAVAGDAAHAGGAQHSTQDSNNEAALALFYPGLQAPLEPVPCL